MKDRTRTLTVLAMFAALAYALMFFLRIPVMPVPPYLKYDPKDIVIVIAGFLYGPAAPLAISAVVSFIEMFTVSENGYWGLLMNILSTCSFACTAAAIYKWRRSLPGAVIGLAAGALLATGVMLLWNYLIVPIYVGAPREFIATMLIPYFLPFNLLKTGLNAGFAILLYKPVRLALNRSQLLPVQSGAESGRKLNPGVITVSVFLIATCILLILAHRNII